MTTTTAGTRCRYDTGSMYGCKPACTAAADVVLTYAGYGGTYTAPLCHGHVGPMQARLYPVPGTVSAIAAPGANRPCGDCGQSVTLEGTGTWRAPFYAPCAVTGKTGHRAY